VTAPDLAWFRGRRVFVSGHTGFKGVWLTSLLARAGAEVTGYALAPATPLYDLAAEPAVRSVTGDIRDLPALAAAFDAARPEVVFHLAAQPLVLDGYREPVLTYETNVMGTVNLLECVRRADWPIRTVVNVTTDKVYDNREWPWPYRETDALNGHDPYSNSKSCSELVTSCYRTLVDPRVAISTARAGNVIGGGDFADNRIVPDCVRAVAAGRPIEVRNPASIRPYQHVLEALSAYLLIARATAEDPTLAEAYNVGPAETDFVTTGDLATLFCRTWGDDATWTATPVDNPPEAQLLRLDSSRIAARLGWRPRWTIAQAVQATTDWSKAWLAGEDVRAVMAAQADSYFGGDHDRR